jgi:hypothetical protein
MGSKAFPLAPIAHVSVPDGPQLLAGLSALAKDQVPFAAAVTLKRLAWQAVDLARAEMPKRFTLRNRGLPRGITADPPRGPNKREWPNLKMHVAITEMARFLALQETGGRKKARGGGRIAIPTLMVHKEHRTAKGKLKQIVRPEKLPDRYEIGGVLRANTNILPKGLTMFYLLRPSAQIEPRLNLRKDVGTTVAQSHDEIFAKELEAAIRSRRTGKKRYSSELGRMRYLRERYGVEGMRFDRGAKMRS